MLNVPGLIILIFFAACSASTGEKSFPVQKTPRHRTLKKQIRHQKDARSSSGLFSDNRLESEVFLWHLHEHSSFGTRRHAEYAKRKKIKNTVVLQRSGRKRLYDHNIFLSEMYKGRIIHLEEGALANIFKKALFIDIGSGILYGKGAPTVRDIFEDHRVWVNFTFIIATDINGSSCRYIDTYHIAKKNLPFPVREIDLKLIWQRDFKKLTAGLLEKDGPIIFRSANSGPDLYYTPETLEYHLRSMALTYRRHNLLYLFNKFILFKKKGATFFEKIGEIDSQVGMSHAGRKWEKIDWNKRKLKDAFIPDKSTVKLTD